MSIPVSTLTGSNTINQMMYNVNTIKNLAANSAGFVENPGSSTDNAVMRFDGTSGGLAQDSSVLIADDGTLSATQSVDSTATFLTQTNNGTASGSGLKITAQSGAYVGKFDIAAAGALAQIGSETNHPLTILTNNTERMRIDSSGNVGIGTTSPDELLDIEGGNVKIGVTGSNAGRLLVDTTTDTVMRLSVNRGGSTGQLAIHTGADTETMRIDSSGKVGIGTTAPAARLHSYSDSVVPVLADGAQEFVGVGLRNLQDNAGGTTISYVDAITNNGGTVYYDASMHVQHLSDKSSDILFYNQPAGTASDRRVVRMHINGSGNVGIGRTPTTNLLEVAGTIESTSGGFKFPDGSTQTSAGASTGKAIAMAIVFG